MIDKALGFVTGRLNEFLLGSTGMSETLVVNAGLVESDGSISPVVRDKVVVTLINVERDSTFQPPPNHTATVTNLGAKMHSPVYFNLQLLIACHFTADKYAESLHWLSQTIEYFNQHPVFDHSTSPGLDSQIERLVVEVDNVGVDQLSNIWSMHGGHYMPSVIYRMRMIAVSNEQSDDSILKPHPENL